MVQINIGKLDILKSNNMMLIRWCHRRGIEVLDMSAIVEVIIMNIEGLMILQVPELDELNICLLMRLIY